MNPWRDLSLRIPSRSRQKTTTGGGGSRKCGRGWTPSSASYGRSFWKRMETRLRWPGDSGSTATPYGSGFEGFMRRSNGTAFEIRTGLRLCSFAAMNAYKEDFPMTTLNKDRFVRLPTELLEALLRTRLSGAQWRIILWVVRQTYGWNRFSAPFTWYRIARDVGMSRPALYRARLGPLAERVLVVNEGRLVLETASVAKRQLLFTELDVAAQQRIPLPVSNALGAATQQKR